MNQDVKLILIAGGTASGKSEIALKLKQSLETLNLTSTILTIDNYYKPINELKGEDKTKINWDVPTIIKWKKLKIDLEALIKGKKVITKIYDFDTSSYVPNKTLSLGPAEFVILEGIFALYDENIMKHAYTKIFVHAENDIRLIRRVIRDRNNRYKEFVLEDFLKKWANDISPMHKKYIEPSKYNSDFIIMNNKDSKDNLKGLIKNITALISHKK